MKCNRLDCNSIVIFIGAIASYIIFFAMRFIFLWLWIPYFLNIVVQCIAMTNSALS